MNPSPKCNRVLCEPLELPEVLDLPAAGTLAETLLKLAGEELTIDAWKVQRLGASCLQVLLSAAQTWKAEGNSLTLAHGSERFIDDLRLLGFTAIRSVVRARLQRIAVKPRSLRSSIKRSEPCARVSEFPSAFQVRAAESRT